MGASELDDPLHCEACAARLSHDQRYCLQCGTRRGSLPRPVAEMLGTMLEQGGGPRPGLPPPPAEPAWTFEPELPFGLTMPSPRAAAVAVLGMLTLGVILGTTVTPPLQTLAARSPLILAVSPHSLASTAVNDVASTASGAVSSSGDNGGGGGGTQTVTVTQTAAAPPTPTPAAGAVSSGGGGFTSAGGGGGGGSTPANPLGLPPVKHLFLIVLSDVGFRQSFAPGSPDTYMSKTLPGQGKLIYNYFAVAGSGLANSIAMLSGQGPTHQTTGDCPTYSAVTPGTADQHHQVRGDGCVYPKSTQTLADQLKAKGETWKAYIEGVDSGPPGTPTSCRHPALGTQDPDFAPRLGDSYVTWRNPFVYFGSLATGCQKNDVGLGGLAYDLQKSSTAPTVAYIAPGPCDDGNPQPCNANAQGGMAAADRFLQTVVPEIEQSAAYQDGGLIAITSDEAPQSGPNADSSACCSNPRYPNVNGAATDTTATTSTTSTTDTTMSTSTTSTTSTTPTTTTTTTTTAGPPAGGRATPTGGGGWVGLLLVSKFVKAGSVDVLDYFNHYSLLATIENLFELKKLGYAGTPGLPVLDSSTFDGTGAGAAADRGARTARARSARR